MLRLHIFQISQILILVAVIAIWVLSRRKSDNAVGGLTEAQLQEARRKVQQMGAQASAAGKNSGSEQSPRPVGALESAFPEWSASTPAHVVLGVQADASEEIIEAAYKVLFKKYHPDRYANWSVEYQKKAHETVLQLQRARSELLSNK